MRRWEWVLVSLIFVAIIWGAFVGEKRKRDWYASHVLRRCEEDPEFRERLRAALGVKP